MRLLILFLSLSPLFASAQDGAEPRTLFDEDLQVSGGFISFTPRFTNVLGTDAALIGFGGGVVLDNWLSLGLAGAWSTSAIKNPYYVDHLQAFTTADLSGLELRYGFGGLLIEPALHGNSAVHVSTPVILGFGSVAYSYPRSDGNNSSSDQRTRTDGQGFFVVEPGVEIEASIIRSLRIGIGGSYIFTSELALPNTSPDALRNFTARFSLKFGSFSRKAQEPPR